jgi:hypothetical protein
MGPGAHELFRPAIDRLAGLDKTRTGESILKLLYCKAIA